MARNSKPAPPPLTPKAAAATPGSVNAAAVSYAIRHFPISFTWMPDLPITNIWSCELEPKCHPITVMVALDKMEIGYCRTGSGIVLVDGRVQAFQAGDVAIINGHELHMSRAEQDTPSQWTYFWMDPALLFGGTPDGAGIASPVPLHEPGMANVISRRLHPEICDLVVRMIDEIIAERPHCRPMLRSLAGELMVRLHRLRPGAGKRQPPACHGGVARIAPALQHMANHYARPIEVEELADLCATSVTHFRRLFRESIGQPPLQYLAQLRARMAAAILRGQPDRCVTDIAAQTGFEALNTFNRQFRRTIGMTPQQWRRQPD